ncbi:hypothetical protein CYVG_00064 [Cyanophage S-SSM6a]|nr:hypothetical protein CYVG_00064 [Cyanophage S-SSM6a]
MKSFEQFEYEQSLVDEGLRDDISFVGANVRSRFQKGKRAPERKISNKGVPTQDAVKSTNIGKPSSSSPNRPSEIGSDPGPAPNIPTRPGRRSDGSKKTGVAATIERNKERATAYAKSERGKKIGRTVGGALGAARTYKPDGEAVDTGASGMGTQMRHLRGIGAAAMDGAIKGYQNRTKDAKKDGRNISGSGAQKGGTTASRGLFGLVSDFAKDKIKKKVGIDSKKTAGGKTITGDVESKYRKGQQERQKQRDLDKERMTPKSETQASKDATRATKNKPTEKSPERIAQDKKVNKALGGDAKGVKAQREIDKQIETARKDTAARDQVKKDFESSYGKGASLKSDEKKPSESESKVKSLVKGAESESKARKKLMMLLQKKVVWKA